VNFAGSSGCEPVNCAGSSVWIVNFFGFSLVLGLAAGVPVDVAVGDEVGVPGPAVGVPGPAVGVPADVAVGDEVGVPGLVAEDLLIISSTFASRE
jgi:hypothetical protein